MNSKIKYNDEPLGEINIVRDFLPSFEDAEDVTAFAERANDPLVSYEDVLKGLKANGAYGSDLSSGHPNCIHLSDRNPA